MDISTCIFSLSFLQPVPEIRRSVFDIEDRFKGSHYSIPFNIYSLPDEAPYELPRISSTTENGHSILTISAQSAQVQSRFDENYSHDFEKCLDYSRKQADVLYEVVSSMPGIRLGYSGVSAQVLVQPDEISKDPADFIHETYLKTSSDLHMSDASVKLVYNVDKDYYLNLEVQRIILPDPLSISVNSSGVSVTKRIVGQPERLSVSVDFNDRLAFNEGRPLGCDKSTIEILYGRVKSFLTSGLDGFLKDGRVSF